MIKGLRAALEFVPDKKSYPIGESIKARFHIQNVSDKAIQIARTTGQTDPGRWIVEDSDGHQVRSGGRMRWMGRDRGIDRRLLKPAILDTEEPLGIAESRTQRVAGARQSAIIEAPGRYVLRYKLVFHKKGDGVWAGELETGKRELVVSAAAGADDNMGA